MLKQKSSEDGLMFCDQRNLMASSASNAVIDSFNVLYIIRQIKYVLYVSH